MGSRPFPRRDGGESSGPSAEFLGESVDIETFEAPGGRSVSVADTAVATAEWPGETAPETTQRAGTNTGEPVRVVVENGRMSIVEDPEHSDGAPTIEGTGIRVKDVAVAYEHSGYEPGEITQLYPDLSLGDVHRALAYYYDHIEEFRSDTAVEA